MRQNLHALYTFKTRMGTILRLLLFLTVFSNCVFQTYSNSYISLFWEEKLFVKRKRKNPCREFSCVGIGHMKWKCRMEHVGRKMCILFLFLGKLRELWRSCAATNLLNHWPAALIRISAFSDSQASRTAVGFCGRLLYLNNTIRQRK